MGEREEIAGVGGREIDTAVGAAPAEVVVPEGSVETIRGFEELDPRYVLDGVVLVDVGALEVVHVGEVELRPDLKSPKRSFGLLRVPTGGDEGCKDGG